MGALLAQIRDLIAANGPLTVASYMDLALQHPDHGYYRNHDPLGRGGDFITAPEISQMFGEMIGIWCADVWRQLGSPDKFVLLELGPGRGTLMQDALRATAKVPGFHQGLQLHLLESNQTLRQLQREKLKQHNPVYISDLVAIGTPPHLISPSRGEEHHRSHDGSDSLPLAGRVREGGERLGIYFDLPQMPIIAIANEFFDALPIRQFEKNFQGWCERLVTMEGDKLAFTLWPLDAMLSQLIPENLREANPGTVFEVSLPSTTIMRNLAKHVVHYGGAALAIDYGFVEPNGRPTLQAVANHEYADILSNPGHVDLTAHVDFNMLRTVATGQGAAILGPIGQGEFLQALGIDLRAAQLKQHATPKQMADIDAALQRLTDPSQMGNLFKVLAITSPQLSTLAGF